MSLIDLFVQDNGDGGRIHKVGDEPHDSLWVDSAGVVHYMNLQNGEGTTGDYRFVPSDCGMIDPYNCGLTREEAADGQA